MIARPVRIDTDTRSGKRRNVADAWRRIDALARAGYTPDGAGGWTYAAFDDWRLSWPEAPRRFDVRAVDAERAAYLTAYVAGEGPYPPR